MSKARNLSDFISTATVDATEIAANAVTTDKILDANITHAKLHTSMDLSGKTVTFAVNQITGNAIDGGVISNFASTGIDDNSSATAVTILSDGKLGIGTTSPGDKLEVNGVINIRRVGDHPAIRFMEDANTRAYMGSGDWAVNGGAVDDFGISASSTGDLLLGTAAGSERMRISNGGNVGVGTTTNSYPKGKLTVHSTPGVPATSGTSTANVGFRIGTTTGNSQVMDMGIYNTSPYGSWIQVSGAGEMSATTPLVLNPNGGNVGIGTSSPSSPLHVSSSNVDVVRISGSTRSLYFKPDSGGVMLGTGANQAGNGIYFSEASNLLYLQTNSTERMRITSAGNVGIGDTTPTSKLTVENNAHGNYLYVGGSTQQNRGLLFTSAVGSLGSDYLGAKHTITAQSGGGEIYIKNDSHDWLALAPNGNVGINRLTPQSKLEVWTGNGQLSHFGSNAANTTNQYTGITLGYAEAAANSNYRKVGIVSVGRGDGAARQDLAFLVDSNSDGNSVDLGDTKMRISHEGYVTLSYQPAFSVRVPYISAQNYTGGATTICLNPSVIYANIGNHFSGSTGRFTAPVAGYYVFGACVRYDSFTGSYFYMTLTKNASTFLARHLSTATGSYLPMTITAATSLAAGDYVHIVVQSSGDSAVAIDGDSNFFGYLVG